MKFDLNVEKQFLNTFCDGGATSACCSCGKEHIAMLAFDSWDDVEPGEVDAIKLDLEERAEKDKNTILHDVESIDLITLGGNMFVASCDCEGWKPYMDFMVNQRKDIAFFLVEVSKEIKRLQSYEDIMDVMRDEYKIPGPYTVSS